MYVPACLAPASPGGPIHKKSLPKMNFRKGLGLKKWKILPWREDLPKLPANAPK
jgi:hypothetical protein